MKIIQTSLKDVLIVEPDVFMDQRGFFMETYHRLRYQKYNIDSVFVQDNLSCSVKNTIRGLHYQVRHPQSKLVQAIAGEIFDVAVDLRRDSSTFKKWEGIYLSDQNNRQVFIPAGFAHGFCVLSETALVLYKCSDFYAPEDEGGIAWCDPDLGINWPVANPIISNKDKQFPCIVDIPPEKFPFQTSGSYGYETP